LNGTILTQSQIAAGGSDKDTDAKTVELASNIAKNIPDLFDIIEASKKFPTKYEQSMNTVIRQVLIQFIIKIISIQYNIIMHSCSYGYTVVLLIHFASCTQVRVVKEKYSLSIDCRLTES